MITTLRHNRLDKAKKVELEYFRVRNVYLNTVIVHNQRFETRQI